MSQLKLLIKASEPQSPGIDLIVVHGVTTRTLPSLSNRWHEYLHKICPPNTQIYAFDADLAVNEKLLFQVFLDRSTALLKAICVECRPEEAKHRSFVILSYGLGGLIVKQTMGKFAQVSLYHHYLKHTTGMIFLATPHFTASDDATIRMLTSLTRYQSKAAVPSATKGDVSALAQDAWRFEKLNLSCPILSCYEVHQLKFRKLGTNRDVPLVDEKIAKISARNEQLVEIDIKMPDFFSISDRVIHCHIRSYLETLLQAPLVTGLPSAGMPSPLPGSVYATSLTVAGKNSNDSSHSLGAILTSSLSTGKRIASQPYGSSDPSYDIVSYPSKGSSDSNPMDTISETEMQVPTPLQYLQVRSYAKPNLDFHGRESYVREIDQIRSPDVSTTDVTRPSVFILCGPAGIGKTQVALHYFHLKKAEFDVSLWVQANNTEILFAAFSQIAVKLGLETQKTTSDPLVSREIVKWWLADPYQFPRRRGGKLLRWLLIFDNADEPDILADFWPYDGLGCVIVTSRDPMARSKNYFGPIGQELSVLPESDAVSLLKTRLGHKDVGTEYETLLLRIVQKLECWPLAIVQMAGVMCRRRLTAYQFLELYENTVNRVEYHGMKAGFQNGYNLTLSANWALKDLSPGAAQLLSVISLLHPSPIMEEILTTSPEKACLPGFPVNRSSYSRDLAELESCSIVGRQGNSSPEAAAEVISHPLIQEVIRSQLLAKEQDFIIAFNAAVRLLSTVWPFETLPFSQYYEFDTIRRQTQCEKLLPHVKSLRQRYNIILDDWKKDCATVEFLHLLNEVGWYNFTRLNFEEAKEYVNETLKVHGECLNDHPAIVAGQFGTLSSIAASLNEPQVALEMQLKSLEIREMVYAETKVANSHIAAAYTEAGNALILNGMFDRAREMIEKSIAMRKSMENFSRLQLYTPLVYLAGIDIGEENYSGAVDGLLQAVKDREMEYGSDDVQSKRTGILLYLLGMARSKQGFLEEGLQYYQRAFIQLQATGGDNDWDLARTCYKLTTHYLTQTDLQSARTYVEQTVSIFTLSKQQKAELARAHFLRSKVYSLLGDGEQAISSLNTSAMLRQELRKTDLRPPEELEEADFDALVSLWYR